VSSGLQIRIAGIDDEAPAPALPAPVDAEFSVVQPAETPSYLKVFNDD
jgi:hypothetical protein